MKIEQAKQVAGKAIEELSHALEAGHSEKLREYLGAMARFHRYFVAQHHANRITKARCNSCRRISHVEAAWPLCEKRRKES